MKGEREGGCRLLLSMQKTITSCRLTQGQNVAKVVENYGKDADGALEVFQLFSEYLCIVVVCSVLFVL